MSQDLLKAVDSFSKLRALVIGDLMVDEYLWGNVRRISPEAPVQIVDVERQEYRLGGCGNVINNLCSLGTSVAVASVVGDGTHGQFLFDQFSRLGVDTHYLILDEDRPATKKTRVIAANQQVVRLDFETRESIRKESEKEINSFLTKNADCYDVILLSDYAKGVVTPAVASCSITNAKRSKVPTIVDPKGKNFTKYSGATILTPNTREAEIATNLEISDDYTAAQTALKILSISKCEGVLITRGKRGMTLLDASKLEAVHIAAQSHEVFDVSGAGDTVLAVLGLGLASGLSLEYSSFLANVAAGVVVTKLGAAAVSRDELFSALNDNVAKIGDSKQASIEQLERLLPNFEAANKRIVFTYDSFDVLSANHIELLKSAKRCGDVLIVGISTHEETSGARQGDFTPIPVGERVKMLGALDYVDYIVLSDNEKTLLSRLRPDICVTTRQRSTGTLQGLRREEFLAANGTQSVTIDL